MLLSTLKQCDSDVKLFFLYKMEVQRIKVNFLFFPKKYVYKALLGLLVLTINIRVDFFKFIELF